MKYRIYLQDVRNVFSVVDPHSHIWAYYFGVNTLGPDMKAAFGATNVSNIRAKLLSMVGLKEVLGG